MNVGRPKSDVKERIISAAHELLRTKGVRAMVQTEVAKAAGVPQGHLTYYFPKKGDLLVAVAQRLRDDTVREVSQLWQSERLAAAGREERLLAVVELLSENRTRTRALLGLAIEADGHPRLADELSSGAEQVRGFLAAVLDKPAPDADVDVVQALFWGLGVQHLVLGGRQSTDQREAARQRARELLRAHFIATGRKS